MDHGHGKGVNVDSITLSVSNAKLHAAVEYRCRGTTCEHPTAAVASAPSTVPARNSAEVASGGASESAADTAMRRATEAANRKMEEEVRQLQAPKKHVSIIEQMESAPVLDGVGFGGFGGFESMVQTQKKA